MFTEALKEYYPWNDEYLQAKFQGARVLKIANVELIDESWGQSTTEWNFPLRKYSSTWDVHTNLSVGQILHPAYRPALRQLCYRSTSQQQPDRLKDTQFRSIRKMIAFIRRVAPIVKWGPSYRPRPFARPFLDEFELELQGSQLPPAPTRTVDGEPACRLCSDCSFVAVAPLGVCRFHQNKLQNLINPDTLRTKIIEILQPVSWREPREYRSPAHLAFIREQMGLLVRYIPTGQMLLGVVRQATTIPHGRANLKMAYSAILPKAAPISMWHDALVDARATADIAKEMMKRMKY